jgi:RND superfamily putative drug exporter
MSGAGEKRPTGKQRSGGLSILGAFLARRPRFVVGTWVLLMIALALFGRNLGDRLQAHPLYVDGTEAKQAHDITLQKFGSDESMIVSLRGPRALVVRQGRELTAGLDDLPKTLVISPWTANGSVKGLRPSPGVAGIVVRVGHQSNEDLEGMLELVEGQIGKTVTAPVSASVAGLPKVFDAYKEANQDAARTGELIAVPILLIVLLLVFRSVLAALIPVVIGGAVVSGTEGIMRLLLGAFEFDAFALGAVGMMGLALGVDYSLLVVSRFREERHKHDLPTAVQVTVEAAGRAIIPAGLGLCLAMLVASQILPGVTVSSSALAIMIATLLSMFSALWMAPAVAMLLGGNLDRWSLPGRFAVRGSALQLTRRVASSPRAVGAVVVVLLFLGVWASTLDSAVATPQLLPPGSPGRVDGEDVARDLGPGWLAPIEVVVNGRGEAMTSPDRLRSLTAFQDQVESDSGVESMVGFGQIERSLKPLSGFEGQLVKQEHESSRLSSGLSRIEHGAAAGSDGLAEAATGAGRLSSGVGSAATGAGLLVQGLDAAHTGSSQLTQGVEQASTGSGRLANGTSAASSSAGRLAGALEKAQGQVAETQGTVSATESAMHSGDKQLDEVQGPLQTAEERLSAAWQALQRMTTGTSDPEYASAQRATKEASEYLSGTEPETGERPDPSYGGVGSGITRAQRQFGLGLYLAEKMSDSNSKASTNAGKLADASKKLDHGIQKLAEGASQLSEGVDDLAKNGKELPPALQRLSNGTEALESGLGQLGVKAGDLAGGLGTGARGQGELVSALRRINSKLEAQSGNHGSQLDELREQSPGLFNSGYFYLAGLDGANQEQRKQANLMIDLDQGGHTARMMVIPRYSAIAPRGRETLERVRDDTRQLAKRTDAKVVVGGLTASQLSINHALRDRTVVLRIVLMLVTLLILIPVLRSLIVPILAMFLNLLTVSASLGMLALFFDNSLLGGPGYVDSAVIPTMVMVIFGLAIDYEVFIFARMREEYLRTGSSLAAIENGLIQTAPVVTGAAFIMIAVFLSFSVSSFVTLRNLGVALAVSIFIDAFIVRLIIVPAAMRALGKWAWWMPPWLDRLIPGGGSLPGPENAAN